MITKYTNNATSVLENDILATDLTLTIRAIDAAKFPSISEAWDSFKIVLKDIVTDNYEVMRVTAIAGSVFTVERAQEGTTAFDWASNSPLYVGFTEGHLDEVRAEGSHGEPVEKSADFTLTPDEASKIIVTTSSIIVTLSEMSKFKPYTKLVFKNTSGNNTVINPFGAESIEGQGAFNIPALNTCEIYHDATEWKVLSLSKYKAETTGYLKMQGLLITRLDVDSIVLETGKCTDSTGQVEFNVTTPLTADVNHEIGLGDGGMPKTVVKTGTFSSTGTAITGTGTSFTTEFKVGDVLWSSSNNEGQVIISILNDTQMVIQLAYSVDVASDAVQKNGLAPFMTLFPILAYNPTTQDLKLVLDTQKNAENALADVNMTGYTVYRRVGSILTDANKYVIDFTAYEKASGGVRISFKQKISIYDGTGSGYTASRGSITSGSPSGIFTKSSFSVVTNDNNSNARYILFTDINQNDSVPSDSNQTITTRGVPNNLATRNSNDFEIMSDENAQIYMRTTAAIDGLSVMQNSYTDERIL